LADCQGICLIVPGDVKVTSKRMPDGRERYLTGISPSFGGQEGFLEEVTVKSRIKGVQI